MIYLIFFNGLLQNSFGMTTIPLSDIKTWEEMGPILSKTVCKPAESSILYTANSEINSLISLLPNGDSTVLEVDAIVNAANSMLLAGGGICGAIHRAAGPELEEACIKIGHTETGNVAVTPGFNLPAKYVIHAVGPIGEKPKALEKTYKSILKCIDGEKIRSVALCCISTGIYGYPILPATKIALKVVREYLEVEENRKMVDRIVFVVFLNRDVNVYKNLLYLYFPFEKDAIQFYKEPEEEEEEEEEGKQEDNKEEISNEQKQEEEEKQEEESNEQKQEETINDKEEREEKQEEISNEQKQEEILNDKKEKEEKQDKQEEESNEQKQEETINEKEEREEKHEEISNEPKQKEESNDQKQEEKVEMN